MRRAWNGCRQTLLLGVLSALGLLTLAGLSWLWWPGHANPAEAPPEGESKDNTLAPRALETPEPPLVSKTLSGTTDRDAPLWMVIDESAVADPPPWADDWSTDGRALVEIAGIASLDWRVGDRLTLPVPQLDETFRAVIEEIDDGFGARALLGVVSGEDGHMRRVVVTVGPESLFAFINTPQGSYELLADRRYGWLLPSSNMMAGGDFSKSDIVLPEHEESVVRSAGDSGGGTDARADREGLGR